MNAETLLSPEVEKKVRTTAGMFAHDRADYDDLIQDIRLELIRHCNDDEAIQIIYLKCWSKAYKHWLKAEAYANHINELFIQAEEEAQDESRETLLSDFLGGLHPADSIEEEIIKREETEIIEQILSTLTPEREKITRLAYSGMSYAAIGRRYGYTHKGTWKKIQVIRRHIESHPLAAQLFTEA